MKNIYPHEIALDNIDFKIIALLCAGRSNNQISSHLKIPVSTVQRRTRNIISSGIVDVKIQPNFKRLGLKTGALHVDLYDGDIRKRVQDISKMDGMISSSVQIGNSDVVNEYAYSNNEQLMDTISNIKHMDGIDKVRWSEEVYRIPIASQNILNSFKNVWNNSSNNHHNNHQLSNHKRKFNRGNHRSKLYNDNKKYLY
jgi:DNA-binding Lrp family transcriptional regulator